MPYPTTYPENAADQQVVDVAGDSCPRLTSSAEVARRLAQLDDHYIRSAFVPLDQLAALRPGGAAAARREIAASRLPQPAYRLDDGTDVVPDDYFTLVDAAGSVDALPAWFQAQYAAAARPMGLPVDDASVEALARPTSSPRSMRFLTSPYRTTWSGAAGSARRSRAWGPSSGPAQSWIRLVGEARCPRSGTGLTFAPHTRRRSPRSPRRRVNRPLRPLTPRA